MAVIPYNLRVRPDRRVLIDFMIFSTDDCVYQALRAGSFISDFYKNHSEVSPRKNTSRYTFQKNSILGLFDLSLDVVMSTNCYGTYS